MIGFSPLIDPPTNVAELIIDPSDSEGTFKLVAPGVKCVAPTGNVYVTFWSDPDNGFSGSETYLVDGTPVLWKVGSAEPHMRARSEDVGAYVSLYDVGKIWSCEPPRPPRHVVTLFDADYFYELDISSATEILFSVDISTTIAFAASFAELAVASGFPVVAGVIYRWRLNTAHRFVHFDMATASIASDKEIVAVRRFEGFSSLRAQALADM